MQKLQELQELDELKRPLVDASESEADPVVEKFKSEIKAALADSKKYLGTYAENEKVKEVFRYIDSHPKLYTRLNPYLYASKSEDNKGWPKTKLPFTFHLVRTETEIKLFISGKTTKRYLGGDYKWMVQGGSKRVKRSLRFMGGYLTEGVDAVVIENNDDTFKNVLREVAIANEIVKKTGSPDIHVVEVAGPYRRNMPKSSQLDDENLEDLEAKEKISLQSERAKIDLLALIHSEQQMQNLSLIKLSTICYSILKGFEAIHKAHILHQDPKPDNTLLFEDKDENEIDCDWAKVSDFGCAVSSDAKEGDDAKCARAGTRGYISPEFFAALQASKLESRSKLEQKQYEHHVCQWGEHNKHKMQYLTGKSDLDTTPHLEPHEKNDVYGAGAILTAFSGRYRLESKGQLDGEHQKFLDGLIELIEQLTLLDRDKRSDLPNFIEKFDTLLNKSQGRNVPEIYLIKDLLSKRYNTEYKEEKPEPGSLKAKLVALQEIAAKIRSHQFELLSTRHTITVKKQSQSVATGAELIYKKIKKVLNKVNMTERDIDEALNFVIKTLRHRQKPTLFLCRFQNRHESTVALYRELIRLAQMQLNLPEQRSTEVPAL